MNKKNRKTSIAAVVLAAGKGKRMNSKTFNKVVLTLGRKPMIIHTIALLEALKVVPIVVVVGFAKDSVISALGNYNVLFAEQKKHLGTAHAVQCGLKKLDRKISDVLVLNGDDSAFYRENLLKRLIQRHLAVGASMTFLTITLDDPAGLGRIIRDKKGHVLAIIEEKDATEKQREIKEVNPACYLFSLEFLRKYLKKVKKSKVSGEYYLVSLVELARKHSERIEAVRGGRIDWRGVNTPKELEEAQQMFGRVHL
ncbi:MAG: NTP transferase domain-containing protein [Candidatus Levybacteria bacterium]|nr:NTP transferase domain-containing protein [Candidatus Levybacteria bacterium]MBI3069697.1 NTP transferase domain-containing protein [Candidatus Levybacteria bacterium]MBI3092818.1 NTP transferase domain-containing protein [Candidatus Levybacteria bacterium]